MRAAAQIQGKTHAMLRTTKDTASFQKSSQFTMTTRAKSTNVGAAQEHASSAESSGKKGADGGAGVVAGTSAGKHEHTQGVAPYYRIQMHLGKDLFEGFCNRNRNHREVH